MRQASQRLESHGRDIRKSDALFLTHDHTDHSRYAADFQRVLDIPVHATEKTLLAINRNKRIKPVTNGNHFASGQTITLGDFRISSISTPHDAVDGVAFVIESEGQRVGILTDLGHAFAGLKEILQSLDAVVIESNYDSELLESGPYPDFLKRRIRGRGGHLSNEDAARLVAENQSSRLQWVCLCHLSDENNCPDMAIRAHQKWLGDDYPIYIAKRHEVSQALQIEKNYGP